MNRIVENITSILDSTGLSTVIDGNLNIGSFELGSLEYELPGGVDYHMVLSNVGDAVVATGSVSADVEGECVRCLERASVHVDSDIEGYFAISEESNLEGMEEDEYEFVPENGEVDLTDCVTSAVVVGMPTLFVCSEDCKGLCPKCGCNRNVESCDCSEQIDEFNPFSVLKGFFDEDGGDRE